MRRIQVPEKLLDTNAAVAVLNGETSIQQLLTGVEKTFIPIARQQFMTGPIKAGEGTLIGNAGEYYVVAELLKRRIIAALAPRNSPAFDILATNGDKTVKVRVKTKSEGYNDWQWGAKADESIFQHLSEKEDFTVLVNLTNETKDLAFYILPTATVDDWLKKDFSEWAITPSKKGQPHDGNTKKRTLSYKKHQDQLKNYVDWDILWK